MKITEIRIYKPLKHNPTFNQSDFIVEVRTDAGLVGVGEGGTRDTLEQCAGWLIGEDPAFVHHHWQAMYRGWFYPAGREKLHALGALDLALWDIKGKMLGAPLYQILGGLTRRHLECYSTGYPWQGSLAETARACIAAGFRAFRTAVGDQPGEVFSSRKAVERTGENCRLIREAIGEDADWSIDFHTRLELNEAVRMATLLEPLNPMLVEDPLRSENPEMLERLRQMVRVPIAVGEQFGDRWDINVLVEKHLIDYSRVTLPNCGGITEFMKIAALCETHGVGLIPHFTGPVSVAALVHCLCALPHQAMMEIPGAGLRQPAHIREGADFAQGKLLPVDRPGLGVTLDPAGLEVISVVNEKYAPIPMFYRPDGSITNW